jgi:hypothetical protein
MGFKQVLAIDTIDPLLKPYPDIRRMSLMVLMKQVQLHSQLDVHIGQSMDWWAGFVIVKPIHRELSQFLNLSFGPWSAVIQDGGGPQVINHLATSAPNATAMRKALQ